MLFLVYGDICGFPLALTTSGTRKLTFENAVSMHLKLREAEVPTNLIVFEVISHAQ